MEVLAAIGGAAAILQLIEQSLAIFQRTQEAINRMKNDASYLAMVSADLSNVVALVQAVKEEPALQQELIRNGIQSLLTQANRLDTFLKELEEKSQKGNILRKFTFQLAKAPVEQMQLADMMTQLVHAKITLLGQIQVLHVGLAARGNDVVVNLVVVNRIDSVLQRLQGTDGGLRIAQLLRESGVCTDAGGEVHLSAEDAKTLVDIASAIQAGGAPSGDLLEVIDNTADVGAFMPNAPIGDGTDDPHAVYKYKTVRVRNNVAKRFSTMINHPISHTTHQRANDHQIELARVMQGIDFGNM